MLQDEDEGMVLVVQVIKEMEIKEKVDEFAGEGIVKRTSGKTPHLPTEHGPLKVQRDNVKSNDAYYVNQSPKLQIPPRCKTPLKHRHSHQE